MGIEPTSLAWEAKVITIIRHPLGFLFTASLLCAPTKPNSLNRVIEANKFFTEKQLHSVLLLFERPGQENCLCRHY